MSISEFVINGLLVLISWGSEDYDPAGTIQWPLTRSEVDVIPKLGFQELYFEHYLDQPAELPLRQF